MMKEFKIALIVACALHAMLLGFIIVNTDFKRAKPIAIAKPDDTVVPVKAVAIDQTKLEKEIKAVKLAETRKKNAEDARVKRLQQQAAKAKREAAAEKKRLAALAKKHKQQEAERAKAAKAAREKLAKMREQQMAEKQRLSKLENERKQQELEKQMQKEEAEMLAKQMAAEQKEMAAARKQQMQSEVEKYTALISHAIGRKWNVPDNSDDNTSCVLLIKLAPGGAVLDVKLVTSSGDDVLDRSATAAVFKASPLPVPEASELFSQFREIRLKVKPEGYLM